MVSDLENSVTPPPSLREILVAAQNETGCTMADLTVLASANDPFRFDTPANHRDGQWLANEIERLKVRLPNHLRGLHYVLSSAGDVVRTNGSPYINDDSDWTWFSEKAAKAARYLSYLRWNDIRDERNEPPELHLREWRSTPQASVHFDIHVEVPTDAMPTVFVSEFLARQRYQIYLVGEKSSLGDVLKPVARRFNASLALPTGEASATMVYKIAKHMDEDGRPAVVFYFSDCDPSGWQMPVSFSRKLQAFKHREFHELDVRVWQTALTPDQVREYGLPSTPLKESERRADRWKEEMGVSQTEVDALMALRADVLEKLAVDAIWPFFDETLSKRCGEAWWSHYKLAKEAFAEQVDAAQVTALRERASIELGNMQKQIDELRDSLRDLVGSIELDLPEPNVPEAVLKEEPGGEIYSTRVPWADATLAMKRRKSYADGGK